MVVNLLSHCDLCMMDLHPWLKRKEPKCFIVQSSFLQYKLRPTIDSWKAKIIQISNQIWSINPITSKHLHVEMSLT